MLDSRFAISDAATQKGGHLPHDIGS